MQGFQGPFPVDMFYRQWKYSDGQVSLLQQILRYPDIFNFVEHHHHPVAVEVLKGKCLAVKVLKQVYEFSKSKPKNKCVIQFLFSATRFRKQ